MVDRPVVVAARPLAAVVLRPLICVEDRLPEMSLSVVALTALSWVVVRFCTVVAPAAASVPALSSVFNAAAVRPRV